MISILRISSPPFRSKIRISSFFVTTANQVSPWVNATALEPPGKEMLPGSSRMGGALNSRNLITNSTTIVVNPAMVVTVSAVTMILSHLTVGGALMGSEESSMNAIRIVVVEIGEDPPPRLDRALVEFLPAGEHISRTRVSALIRKGAVSCDGNTVTDPAHRTGIGECWRIAVPRPESAGLVGEAIELSIVHEDADLLVVNKKAGMVVHPARGNWSGTLVNALLHHCGEGILSVGNMERPGIVHRLDKETTGLLVVAKTDWAADSLATQFEERTVSRSYIAIVRGVPGNSSGFAGYSGVSIERNGFVRIEGNIGRSPTHRIKMAVVDDGGRHAVTRVRSLEQLAGGSASLVECRLETGRTHQIRVHMEHIGHPLVCDPLYGTGAKVLPSSAGESARKAAASFGRQALHASTLEFEHPRTGKRQGFESDLPEDMRLLLDAMSGKQPEDNRGC